MRLSPQLLIALLPALAVAFPSSSAQHLACLRLRAEDLAADAACGIASFIARNLRSLPDALSSEDVEDAFRAAGCSATEATDRALDALGRCNGTGDLRKREALLPANGWVPVTATPKAHIVARDTATATAATDATATAETAASSPSPTSLKCSTTRTESTTTCTQSTVGIETCVPTIALYAKCADGLLCSKDHDDICMVAKTTLDTGGLIVTIFFSAALTLSIALLTFMCCKERAMHKRLAAKAEAAEIAKEAAAASRKTRADTQPLMAAGSPGGARAQSPASPGGFGSNTDTNPFHDGNRL